MTLKFDIRDTKAARELSAVIVLKRGKVVAQVMARHAGAVTVNVWQYGEAQARSAEVLRRMYPKAADSENLGMYQSGRAGGYGYDKKTAAMRGMVIDGVRLYDHCGHDEKSERLFKQYCKFHDYSGEVARSKEKGWDRAYWDKRAARIGARFANWDCSRGRYGSLFYDGGLDRLERMGYTLVHVL